MGVVASGAALLLGARAASLAMGVGVYAVLTRELSTTEFGLFTTALAVVQLAATPMDYALGPLTVREAIRHPSREPSLVRRVGQLRIGLGLLLAAALALASPTILGPAGIGSLVVLLGVLPASWLLAVQPVLQRRRALRALAWLALVQGGTWLALVALLAALGAPPVLFAAGYVAAQILYGAAMRWAARPVVEGGATVEDVDARAFVGLLRAGAGLALVAVLGIVYFKVDALLVFRLRGPVEAAHYGVAMRILEQAAIVPMTLHNVFLPRLLGATSGSAQLGRIFDQYLRVVLLVAVPLVAVGVLVADPVLRTVFGERYGASSRLTQIVLLAFVPICAGYVVTAVAIATSSTGRQVAAAATALASNVGLNLWLVPRYGAGGAATVTVVTEVVVVSLLYWAVRDAAGIRLPWAWLARLSLVVLAALAPALVIRSPFGRAVAFAAVYGPLLLAAQVVSWRDLRAGRARLAMANS